MTVNAAAEFVVVGGGIGGLAAAYALGRQGQAVRVLEAAPQFGEIGAGIQLAPNATQVLERLGLLPPVLDCSVLPSSLAFMDARTGERLTSVDLGRPFRERYGTPYVVLHRTDLHAILLEACQREDRIALEVNRRVVLVDADDERPTARCADGSSYAGQAVIGADGLHSVVRTMVSTDEPVVSGYVAYRGAISVANAHLHEFQDSMVYWWGPGLHLVQYKVRRGELYNQVGVFRSRVSDPDSEEFGSPAELDEVFGSCCEPVRRGATLLERGMRWLMIDRDPLANWSRGRTTLLGDAAHPMLQYLAQGGCQALEDALCLAEMVASHDDVAEAFAAYQAVRIPHTSRVVNMARTFGEMIHIDGIGLALRNRLLAQHAADDFTELDWLYFLQPTVALAQDGPPSPLDGSPSSR
ncbi:MAG: FAD-dependent monooxygenase [Actinomycetota bacterium]|nr:FAD-dependent monooxygenase [Actinomycetota bacterium]